LDDKDAIINELSAFLDLLKSNKAMIADEASVKAHSREARTQLLSELLNEC